MIIGLTYQIKLTKNNEDMKYKVRIIETLSRIIEVDAEDEIDALNTVEDMYCDGGIVLDSEDFDFVDYVINED